MGFVAVCTAVYDYQPQSSGELEIKEGELLYILEKSADDDWWKAKKKAAGDDDDEPEGLIPNNYVEEAKPTHSAKALYDYTRQTDEEVSFTEDAALDVYDTSDPDWTLVGLGGDFGFAPANYIEILGDASSSSPATSFRQPAPAAPEPAAPLSPSSPTRVPQSPAAASLARVLGGAPPTSPTAARHIPSPPRQELTPEASDDDEEAPALPQRPQSQARPPPISYASQDDESQGVLPSPPYNRAMGRPDDDDAPINSPGGYHLYNINEMVSAMGRRRKMPTTLGINIATGTILLSPEKSRDGPSQEWTADKMTHYSIEGKHVFIEFVRPSKSLDLHAGAKDTAEEIVRALGEIAGAHRAEGIREVIEAATGGASHKKGQILYDFMAQGDDEVTVGVGDEVIVLDDTKSEEWWNVRRLKNGKEGVVPSSYIEVTGFVNIEPPSRSGINAGLSTIEQNRLEEQRLAREAARADKARQEAEQARSRNEIPPRGSSLADDLSGRRDRKDKDDRKKRSKPDTAKVRTWTDHSGTFKVEAQFLGISDGKIHLHKVNGVKIAVPVTKMSPEDLEYIEKVTNESIEEHIPVADLIKMKRRSQQSSIDRSGASIVPRGSDEPKVPDYDWFDFFLKAGVGPHQCERYSQAMVRDSMDESVLPDITAETLRTLGLKEGDTLKVIKYLDQRFGRARSASVNGTNGEAPAGGIFSGPGGALHNNTRRGRPDANRQTTDVVDADAFSAAESDNRPRMEGKATPLTEAPSREPKGGFDDDAWTVKPSAQSTAPTPAPAAQSAAPAAPKLPTGAIRDLSLLDAPLVPTPAQPSTPAVSQPAPAQQQQPPPPAVAAPPMQQPQQTGANAQFFSQLPPQQTGIQPQQTGFQPQQFNAPRQRPMAPQSFTGTNLLPPPPRPTSAPQNPQQSQFGLQALQPQLTGIPRTSAQQAPPGQSLNDINQQRLQQQYQQMQMQSQPTGYGQFGLVSQPTGFQQQQQFPQFQQPYLNGNAAGSPFADPRPSFQQQPTGIPFQQTGAPGGVNSVLPPALQPQRTGYTAPLQQAQTNGFGQGIQPQPTGFGQPQPFQPQPTGFQQQLQPQPTGFGQPPQQNGYQSFSPPPIPQFPTVAALQPQKTGPAPNVKFGTTAKKLTPQPTGRRANLAHATADNPFGF
ncbi:cytoskeletal protein binding protein [Elasticomyces elasticus]|uniref:Actin cytoskeleton-regulatory complex protein SLA1 n=1 Tax=Exophiala sideris TaxID=1016849 RepID=A0ABR0J4M2_9EURO|nr:cytoskeletal protein binding protein [Elasticomyces elasticus]KAK5027404.1 cytoskeletal protein binding protein [Exophiala sideris]KAK5034894.1 cytoskeletal protein binding protein [Exophiala sideris]KAK5056372.1 cytoskeletal protein binding protein [Exophiala sideris]KAK5181139.1 cytoskeletal protein binding protein [Eurotiomycetes sp. CCFEE 6388]